jgi:excisionase family DNA binding protein
MYLTEGLRNRTQAITAGELASLLGVSDKMIYRMAATGKIPHFRVGAAIRFDPGAISDWLGNIIKSSVAQGR